MNTARPVHDERLQLGRDAVLSVATACRLLPGRDADVRAWLRRCGLVVSAPWSAGGREVVVWGDVLDALRGRGAGMDADEPAGVFLPQVEV